ncbi:energy transducer TonB [Qipengyuania marisflavi]|uniref:TonB family protein n=1 Tax=Qipengyuania marisflavi TaxID=2486356 RepID=A0A5S3P6L8_9SPHN|nr:TonB family protein [Qipengyuania marisflavi]TMM48871.1 TonB family protein [Qipengyuania marisflavi]
MAYVDQSRRPSPTSMAAVVAVHVAIAAALVAGLTVSGIIAVEDEGLEVTDYTLPPPPEPPETEPEVTPKSTPDTMEPKIFVPTPKLDLERPEPRVATSDVIFPPLPPIPQPGRGTEMVPKPTPSVKAFDVVAAKPKNDPGGWLSDADYRPSWARQELTGLARFRLEIAANGRVSDCRITGSTGHNALDKATCALVTKRARFEPARGADGAAAAGSYNGAVQWQLPE